MAKHSQRQQNKLSEHFSKRDFVCRCGHCEHSLKISLGLLGGLELLRSTSRNRIQILKGYQCPDSSEKMGKVKRNHHIMGIAADILLEKRSLSEAFLLAEAVPEFNGIGLNIKENHIHVDTRKDKERYIFVITKEGEELPLTDANRHQFLPASETPQPKEDCAPE